jgi:iron complex outermembrane receptor protein
LPPAVTKSNGWNSNLSAEAGITPDLLVYLARRTGYRPGGLNTVTNSAGLPSFTPAFSPEKVKDFELGAKYDFRIGDARARINAAAYKTEYTNIQVGYSAAVNGVTATYTVNAAAAQIKGLEVQGQLRAGRWDISGNYAYTDAAYKRFVGPDPLSLIKPGNARCLPPATTAICLLDLSPTPFPFVPKHQASLNVRYTLPVDESLGEVTIGGSAFVQSRRYFGSQVQRIVEAFGEGVRDPISQKAYERYNLRADWRNVRGTPVSLAAFVNNVTDVDYKISTVTQLHSLGNSVSLYGEPRTYGVEFRYEFGR